MAIVKVAKLELDLFILNLRCSWLKRRNKALLKNSVDQINEELVEALEGMVDQHCFVCKDGQIDSSALSANAQAMRLLAEVGRFKITREYGRRVIGSWVPLVEKDKK